MTGFTRPEGVLLCDGRPVEEAAAAHGTPLYLYSAASLVAAYDSYTAAFAPVPHQVCYAVKANSSGALLRLLAERGAGADIVSGFELKAALRAGFAPERIVFSGVGKSDQEIALGVETGIGDFNAESEDELARISAIAEARGARAPVTLRVNPDIDARSHPYISTGLRDNKFGVDISLAGDILRRARDLRGVKLRGVQCHIGSQIRDLEPLARATRELVSLSRTLLAEGFPLDTIDLGGGLGVDYETGAVAPVAAFAQAVLPLLEGLPLKLLLEPGRSLVATAGVLLTRVLYVKENHGRSFVIVDAGMNDLMRPALYDAYHRIERVAPGEGRRTRRVDVVGPVCESGDFLARDRELPEVGPGDLLAIRDAGAYGFAMTSNYNLRPRPAEVLAENGAFRLIRRRETFEDLVALEISAG